MLLFFGAFFVVYNNSYRMISGVSVSVYPIENGMALKYGSTVYSAKYNPNIVKQFEVAVGETPSILPLPAQMTVLLTEIAEEAVNYLP